MIVAHASRLGAWLGPMSHSSLMNSSLTILLSLVQWPLCLLLSVAASDGGILIPADEKQMLMLTSAMVRNRYGGQNSHKV